MPARHPRRTAATITAATAALALAVAAPAGAAPNTNSSTKLQKAVTADGVLDHLDEFEDIAEDNGDNRAAGSRGYEESAEYVHDELRDAGYDVEYQEFDFDFYTEVSPSEFSQVSPDAQDYVDGVDFDTMQYSGSGDVTATVEGVDLALDDPASSTSGCEAADFDGFTSGNIALVQRGACAFGTKAVNAEAAGAAAVIVFNQGSDDTPDRQDVFFGTLGGPVVSIPAIGTSFAVGVDLADPATTEARVVTDTISETRTTRNVIAETRTGRDDNVVMVGAHLDSVPEGPGFNDNGSGSAAILEVALKMRKVKPNNTVRFAWWSAEEAGLVGSTRYVESLTPEEREDIALYLNFDMIGSPNFMRGVYDGSGDLPESSAPIPEGSAAIEALFNDHFDAEGLPYQDSEFSGRSDYQAFILSDIPAGGLFTGAEGVKTADEAARYGGVAGESYDPCYHQACDSGDPVDDGADEELYEVLDDEYELEGNVAVEALDTNADAIAHAVITYAFDTSSVNGVESGPQDRKGEKGKKGKKGRD